MLYYALFLFVALGAKFILALITIYLLFPTDRSCVECNAETLLVRTEYAGRILSFATAHRLLWRWCPRCGWEGWTRTHRHASGMRPAGAAHSGVPRHH